MTFFFDLTPFVILGVILSGCVIIAIGSVICSVLWRLVFYPLKHWKTKLKLYRFERQCYNSRIIEQEWFKTDREARVYQAQNDFYSFCTQEVYPKRRYLDDAS